MLVRFILSLSVCLAGSLRADVSVSQSGDAPAQNVIFSQTSRTDGNNWIGLPSMRRDAGQAFKAAKDSRMSAITLWIEELEPGVYSAPFTVKVFETEAYHSPLKEDRLISVQSGVLPETLEGEMFATFILGEPVDITVGRFYTVVLSFDAMAPRRTLKLGIGSNPDSEGDRWVSEDGVNYTRIADPVFSFYVQSPSDQ